MHIYFAGIGGSGMSSLALVAKQAGYEVSGSDSHDSAYIDYLKKNGVTDIHIGQSEQEISQIHKVKPIDWLLYSPALPMTNPDHPELVFAKKAEIKTSREDDFVSFIIKEHGLKLIAVAGTHGKSTTTAMAIWLFKQLGLPVSYSFGGKLSFGKSGEFYAESEYFVLEADEFDRKFLSFYPELSLITGIDWDHPDIYPTRQSYLEAFKEFIDQSNKVFLWHDDAEKLSLASGEKINRLNPEDGQIDAEVKLAGRVNRLNAWLVANSLHACLGIDLERALKILDGFPGLGRRFEKIADNLYTDYAHTPPKIRGALQLAREVAADNVVVVYEGLHNLRQHFIKDDLANLFNEVKQLYIVPSYLAREDPNQPILSPTDLVNLLSDSTKARAEPAKLDEQLKTQVEQHLSNGDLVLCLSAGGAGSLDEWLRQEFKS